MALILVVDDERWMLEALTVNLRARKYDVMTAVDAAAALRIAVDFHPDLIVLDLGLPDMDGLDIIRGLRGWTDVPILVLSGRSDPDDRIEALDVGADDYLTKPFVMGELFARIRALQRRSVPADFVPVAHIGRYTVDLPTHTVTPAVHLTGTEWRVLEVLIRNPGKLISQSQLLTEVWGPAAEGKSQYLREYLGRLRRKLEDDPAQPRHLITELAMGYRFVP
ncbi:response regulator [Nocardia africana]|uniref:KDP operon transcriptional regulatory protein KdpE n=1 Tax=Nocardia africana TaxID=134964 RepID=A0A378WWA2_9NOCA|nr:response regulator [Nocardia africana]MCC3313702.1 response regulator [Nocardia africana]SUA44915.1 KDP operon transcriptional regulatory protein KdpE [Nocardia africana]